MQFNERFPLDFQGMKNKMIRDSLLDIEFIDFESPSYGILNPDKTIFIGSNKQLKNDIFDLFLRTRAHHFVQLSREDYLENLFLGSQILKFPGRFLQAPYPSFFSVHASNSSKSSPPPQIFEFQFRIFHDRLQMMSQMEAFLSLNENTAKITPEVMLITDELFKNALFSPIDIDGRRLFHPSKNKITDAKIDETRPAKLFVVYDQKKVLVGCQDFYGSLNPNYFLDSLYTLDDPILERDLRSGQSGLGFRNIIEKSSDLIVVSRRNIQTLVCIMMPLGLTAKKLSLVPKNFHFHFF